MITNQTDPVARDRLEACRREIGASGPFLDALQAHPDPFRVRTEAGGFEFTADREVEGRPNRARLKVFMIPDGPMSGQPGVFFYKGSNVPFSRDRFSYGVCILPAANPSPDDLKEWLDFASGGFDPEARPRKLRLAFTFTVPE